MKFIKINTISGRLLFVNPSHITEIYVRNDGVVCLSTVATLPDEGWTIEENIETLTELIKQAGGEIVG